MILNKEPMHFLKVCFKNAVDPARGGAVARALFSRSAYLLLGLILGMAGMVSCGKPEAPASIASRLSPPAKRRLHYSDEVFTNNVVLKLKIEISQKDMAVLARSQPEFAGGERPVVKAIVREGTTIYTNVAVHVKGAAGSFRPIHDNPGLTLNFDKFAKGQLFHGMDKISLNNSIQDSSFLSEKICRELMDAAGVPVPRAGFAQVTLNGRDLGLRVMTEGFGERFLKGYFENTKGNLYDGGFCKEITERLSTNSGENPEDRSDLDRLIAAVRERDFSKLEAVLDMDRFLTLVAMEVILYHWDGYALNRNNYRVYHDLDTGRMVFMPHGMDQMFGTGRGEFLPIHPNWNGTVARAVLATREGRKRYSEKVTQLLTDLFRADAITARVDELAEAIRPAVVESSYFGRFGFDHAVSSLKSQIVRRERDLKEQLGRPVKLMTLKSSGEVPLPKWNPRITRANPNPPEFAERELEDGLRVMEIGLTSAGSGSWRAELNSLPPGRYRFEGRVKYEGVKAEAGGGVVLRISGERESKRVVGTSDWTKLAHEFEVLEPAGDVVLVCELAGTEGRVWFDKKSVKVVRESGDP